MEHTITDNDAFNPVMQFTFQMGSIKNFCGGTHCFLSLGDTYEGMTCACGAMIAHYEICDHCRSKIFKPIPNPNYITTKGIIQ